MCDAFLQRYASALNAPGSPNVGDPPYVPMNAIVFSGANCSGTSIPDVANGFPLTEQSMGEMKNNQAAIVAPWTIRSAYIPPNVEYYLGPNTLPGGYLTSLGSRLISETQSGYGTPTSLYIKSRTPYSTLIKQMCMGRNVTVGSYAMTRYKPQSPTCDTFMNNFCANEDNKDDADCECLLDMPNVLAMTQPGYPALPVNCFSQKCAQGSGYKTSAILGTPCNAVVCQQRITESAGSFASKAEFNMFCSGKFYSSTTGKAFPTPKELDNPFVGRVTEVAPVAEEVPYYVWIIYGVCGFFFCLLAYFAFAPDKKREEIEKQIAKLRASVG